MNPKTILLRMVVLIATMMCALGVHAAEAYACYTPENTTLTFYYDNQRGSQSGTTYDLNTDNHFPDWEKDATYTKVTKVVFDPSFAGARPTSTFYWFGGMIYLETIEGMSYLNTSEVTNMEWMFSSCLKLTSLDLSHFNTSKVTEMGRMFSSCRRLTSLDLSSFNTSKVTIMSYMFFNCSNLLTIYVGDGWSTEVVTESYYMFSDSFKLVGGQGMIYDESNVNAAYAHIDGGPGNPGYLTAVGTEAYACYTSSNTLTFFYDKNRSSRSNTYDLNIGTNAPGWYNDGTYVNVTKVVFESSFAGAHPTSTSSWFCNMQNLQSIEGMRYLNTSEVTNMDWMFLGCSKLTSLDLSSFNTSKVNGMLAMFGECSNLRTIYVGDGWNTDAVTVSTIMFSECTSLVGGQGTTWNSSNPTDKTYACIDGGNSKPGYFSPPCEAYACYTSSNTTLTFYYDNQRTSRTGTTYDLNSGNNSPSWHTDGTNESVTKVVFNSSFTEARPTTTHGWFNEMKKLQTIEGLSYLNTSEVTNMAWMFACCYVLESLDLSSFNTAKVSDMSYMFYSCRELESLDLSSFNTSKVINMYSMFDASIKLKILDLSSFNTSKVTNMDYMLSQCGSLRTIYVGDGWNTDAVTKSDYIFFNSSKLVGGQGTTFDANHIDKAYAHIDGGSYNPGYFTNAPRHAYACYTPENTTLTFYCDRLQSTRSGSTYDLNTGINTPGWCKEEIYKNVTKVVFDSSFADILPTTTYFWFYGMMNLETIEGMSNLTTSEVKEMSYMFDFCYKLTSLDLSGFNTRLVAKMDYMFNQCTSLRTIYVGDGWTTNAVKSSRYMFNKCTSLVGGQGTTYNADHVDMTYAHIDGGPSNPGYFTAEGTEAYACYTSSNTTLTFYYDNLRSSRSNTYDLNTGGISPVWMTNGTYNNVTKVVFDSSFAGVRPTTTYGWLLGMIKLKAIEGMSYLNTSQVTNMSFMFYYCSSLKSFDLSNFNTSNVTEMEYMFGDCSDLHTIYVGDGWSTDKVTKSNYMFLNCTNLVGGQGTTWSSSNPIDMTYAHIDGGSSNPGYFTYRNTGITTDIANVQRDAVKVQSEEWFTIDGQKLSGQPTKKGVYIHNGRAVVL